MCSAVVLIQLSVSLVSDPWNLRKDVIIRKDKEKVLLCQKKNRIFLGGWEEKKNLVLNYRSYNS